MARCKIIGNIAFKTDDFIPMGGIEPVIYRQLDGEPTKAQKEIIEQRVGRSVKKTVDKDGKASYFEEIKQVPAKALSLEVVFTSTVKSSTQSLADQSGGASGGFGFLGTGTGSLAAGIAATTLVGGNSFGKTKFSIQIMESSTIWDMPIVVTEDVIRNGSYDFGRKIPITILGVFKEKITDKEGTWQIPKEELATVGISSPGNGFSPPTANPMGQFDGDFVKKMFGSLEYLQEQSLFNGIFQDNRRLMFRADSQESVGGLNDYQIRYSGSENFVDSTSSKILLKPLLPDIKVGDVLYVSGIFATKRHVRQNWEHKATVFEGSNRTGQFNLNEIVAIGSIEAQNYKIAKWKVQPLFGKYIIEERANLSVSDLGKLKDYKVDVGSYLSQVPDQQVPDQFDTVEGWRLTELITDKVFHFYGMDRRGIWLGKRGDPSVSVIVPPEKIRDQSWYQAYLDENNLRDSDLSTSSGVVGTAFDVSEFVSSIFSDQEKVPYYRPFAIALKKVSKYNPQIRSSGVGVSHLDMSRNGISVPLDTADLSFSVFDLSDQTSYSIQAYSATTCSADRNFSSFRSELSSSGFQNIFGGTPAPDVSTDWLIQTPYFRGKFGKKTRIYVERYAPDRINQSLVKYGLIYVNPIPFSQSSLSIDETYYKDYAYAFYDNVDTNALTYHKIEQAVVSNTLNKLSTYKQGNHTRPTFSHKDFKEIGYSMLAGSSPCYSNGRTASVEWFDICRKTKLRKDVYKDDEWKFSLDGEEITVKTDDGLAFREIVISYVVRGGVSGDVGFDNHISLQFGESDVVINNIYFPIGLSDFSSDAVREFRIDGFLSIGSPIKIRGKVLGGYIDVVSVKTVSIPQDRVENFEIIGSQTATVVDGLNKIFVFFHDEDSGNISVSVSADAGSNWYIERDIIRLVDGEVADLPYAIVEKSSNTIYLFYRLNNSYLMVKPINSAFIGCQDTLIKYVAPANFDANSDDNLNLELYSDTGRILRKINSTFVLGEGDDFFTRQIKISADRSAKGLSFRFSSPIKRNDVKGFENADYAVYKDVNGEFVLFTVLNDGKVYIKRSPNGIEWSNTFIAESAYIHKTLKTDLPDAVDLSISNIQVVYDNIDDRVYVLYVYRSAMYLRIFRNALLKVTDTKKIVDDVEGSTFLSENIKEEMQIKKDSGNISYFLVGEISQEILDSLKEQDEDLAISVRVPNGIEAKQFLSNFLIDTGAKPAGYVTANGIVRFFYKSDEGQVYGISFNEGEAYVPRLDVQRRALEQ